MSIEQQMKIIEYFIFCEDKSFDIIKTDRINFDSKHIFIKNEARDHLEIIDGYLFYMNGVTVKYLITFDSCLDFYNSYKEDRAYCFLSHGRTIPALEAFLSCIESPIKEEMFDFIDKILSGEIKCI